MASVGSVATSKQDLCVELQQMTSKTSTSAFVADDTVSASCFSACHVRKMGFVAIPSRILVTKTDS